MLLHERDSVNVARIAAKVRDQVHRDIRDFVEKLRNEKDANDLDDDDRIDAIDGVDIVQEPVFIGDTKKSLPYFVISSIRRPDLHIANNSVFSGTLFIGLTSRQHHRAHASTGVSDVDGSIYVWFAPETPLPVKKTIQIGFSKSVLAWNI